MVTTTPRTRPGEGIAVQSTDDGLLVRVVRHDVTRVSVAATGVIETIAELAARGGFFLVDGGFYESWSQRLGSVLEPGRHLVLAPGEGRKTLQHAEEIVTALHAAGVHRGGPVVAVGGGVTTDLGGLVAALYFRGVPAVYVPTTLLAMLDAAIGGKTGVNHPLQKNLIGTFTHPAEVHIRLDALTTLPRDERVSAYGEALKIAIVDDPDLFDVLAGLDDPPPAEHLEAVVRTCVRKKLELLGGNCFERCLERALNLGHTVAHPVEDTTGFRIRHGTAVGIGIAVACHISHRRRLLDADTFTRILTVMTHLGLPVMDPDIDVALLSERIRRLVAQRGGSSLHYVLPVGMGKVTFTDTITPDELAAACRDLREFQEAR